VEVGENLKIFQNTMMHIHILRMLREWWTNEKHLKRFQEERSPCNHAIGNKTLVL